MEKKTKGQISKELNLALGRLKQMEKKNIRLESVVRNYKTHMKAMKNKLDYLLKHPYAKDTGYGRRKK